MNAIWIIIIMVAHGNGQVDVFTQYPLESQYNNEKSCNDVGQQVADNEQLKFGLNNAKVYWKCDSIPVEAIKKLVPGQNI